MNHRRSFVSYSKLVVVMVFLVILAGGVVRMTQSGMGCPDWPKCFGRWVPPVSVSQLPSNYKQLYAFKYVDTSFNPYHTWIEYINRLLGALLGFLLVAQFIWSLRFLRTDNKITWLCLTTMLLTGFQGWLGSKVVEANLEAVKVTTHMLVALVIAALSVSVVYRASETEKVFISKKIKTIAWVAIFLMIIQISLGTRVREEVDLVAATFNFEQRNHWVEKLGFIFYLHRSFSILVALVCFYLFVQYQKFSTLHQSAWLILFCVAVVAGLGVTMAYFNIPAIAQPLHLLFSSLLIIILYYNSLRTRRGSP
ncbi:MAG: COX15/CtaA family protein [Ginsengibacter sp.]